MRRSTPNSSASCVPCVCGAAALIARRLSFFVQLTPSPGLFLPCHVCEPLLAGFAANAAGSAAAAPNTRPLIRHAAGFGFAGQGFLSEVSCSPAHIRRVASVQVRAGPIALFVPGAARLRFERASLAVSLAASPYSPHPAARWSNREVRVAYPPALCPCCIPSAVALSSDFVRCADGSNAEAGNDAQAPSPPEANPRSLDPRSSHSPSRAV